MELMVFWYLCCNIVFCSMNICIKGGVAEVGVVR